MRPTWRLSLLPARFLASSERLATRSSQFCARPPRGDRHRLRPATLFALRVARAASALAGRTIITDADIALAARLALAPRATRLPPEPEEAAAEDEPPSAPDPGDGDDDAAPAPDALTEIVLAAVRAALPAICSPAGGRPGRGGVAASRADAVRVSGGCRGGAAARPGRVPGSPAAASGWRWRRRWPLRRYGSARARGRPPGRW